jgi:hypothetical protein
MIVDMTMIVAEHFLLRWLSTSDVRAANHVIVYVEDHHAGAQLWFSGLLSSSV